MRLLCLVPLLVLVMMLAPACKKKSEAVIVNFQDTTSKFSYAIGLEIGTSLKDIKGLVDVPTLIQGLKDQLDGKTPVLNEEEAMQAKQAGFARMQKAKAQDEDKFFVENGKKPGVQTTPSGLQYQVITEGKGPKPGPTSEVTVHYVGTLLDGKEFDSSIKRGQPISFPLNGVIPGWTEGVQLMNAGAKYKLFVPSRLGYGERGTPGGPIPPNATLIFEIELISFK